MQVQILAVIKILIPPTRFACDSTIAHYSWATMMRPTSMGSIKARQVTPQKNHLIFSSLISMKLPQFVYDFVQWTFNLFPQTKNWLLKKSLWLHCKKTRKKGQKQGEKVHNPLKLMKMCFPKCNCSVTSNIFSFFFAKHVGSWNAQTFHICYQDTQASNAAKTNILKWQGTLNSFYFFDDLFVVTFTIVVF